MLLGRALHACCLAGPCMHVAWPGRGGADTHPAMSQRYFPTTTAWDASRTCKKHSVMDAQRALLGHALLRQSTYPGDIPWRILDLCPLAAAHGEQPCIVCGLPLHVGILCVPAQVSCMSFVTSDIDKRLEQRRAWPAPAKDDDVVGVLRWQRSRCVA